MGDDETATLSALKRHLSELITPKIAEHSGRIVKTTGDGFLAEFASVVAAVQCATEIQDGMSVRNADVPAAKRLQLKIGINLGDILSEGDDIFGDGVNIAARLEGLCEPGGILLSGSAHEQVRNKIALAYEDIGPQTLKNIAQPVHAFRVKSAVIPSPSAAPPLPDKPSIAVLPFDNMSGDPEQQYFSDGITEDIITELSRFRQLFVIARNSSFVFRGKPVDVGEIGRKLGIQYLVEGSVRKSGDRIRITAQLVDTISGVHLWADRYDRELKDLFSVQDELAHTLAATLVGVVETSALGRLRRKPTDNLTAYDCYLQGVAHHDRATAEERARAQELLERAVNLDPDFSLPYPWLALCHLNRTGAGAEASLEKGLELAKRAVALDATESRGHVVLGFAYLLKRRFDRAEAHMKQAVSLNVNDGHAAAHLCDLYSYVGRGAEGIEWVERAMRLNPFHPDWYRVYRAQALYVERRYGEAADALQQVTTASQWDKTISAACYAMAGLWEEAQARTAEVLVLEPNFSCQAFTQGEPFKSEADAAHLMEGLLKAGLPP